MSETVLSFPRTVYREDHEAYRDGDALADSQSGAGLGQPVGKQRPVLVDHHRRTLSDPASRFLMVGASGSGGVSTHSLTMVRCPPQVRARGPSPPRTVGR